MCGQAELAIIKAEPGGGYSTSHTSHLTLFPSSNPSTTSPLTLYPSSTCSPPTISLQEASTSLSTSLAPFSPPTTTYPSIASPIPLSISLSLPSPLVVPLHPLHPPSLPRSPLLSISEVTNTLLDHNCNQ